MKERQFNDIEKPVITLKTQMFYAELRGLTEDGFWPDISNVKLRGLITGLKRQV